jgi:uncharacterized protein
MTTLHSAPELRRYAPERIEVRDLDAGHSLRTLVGRAVPYDTLANVGWYLEQIAPGAFNKSIEEAARNLPLLLWHDSHTIPVGQAARWTSKSDGLWGEWSLDSSAEAQNAARAAQDGRLASLSIGFMPVRSQWTLAEDWDPDNEAHMDTVTRVEGRLLETSMTSTPAFVDAVVTEVRSLAAWGGVGLRTADNPRRRIPIDSAYPELAVGVAGKRTRRDLDELRRWRSTIPTTEDLRAAAQSR